MWGPETDLIGQYYELKQGGSPILTWLPHTFPHFLFLFNREIVTAKRAGKNSTDGGKKNPTAFGGVELFSQGLGFSCAYKIVVPLGLLCRILHKVWGFLLYFYIVKALSFSMYPSEEYYAESHFALAIRNSYVC